MGGTYTFDWFMEKFSGGSKINEFESLATQIHPGSDGLMLVPYWNSVLTPYLDPTARGIVVGWTGIHGPAHLYRAILEGIAYELHLHFERIEIIIGTKIRRLVVTGGGSISNFWVQFIADITSKVVYLSVVTEATALGSGILAAYGAGLFPDINTAAEVMCATDSDVFTPQPETKKYYTFLYEEVYKNLYLSIKHLTTKLDKISSGG